MTQQRRLEELQSQYAALRTQGLKLDLTRGKPAPEQLDLSNELDGMLAGDFYADGTDLRNYGGLDGLPAAKQLGAGLLDVPAEQVMVGGNSSLTLMYHTVLHAMHIGVRGAESAWSRHSPPRFLCPVPGYDRHFAICEELGIEMIPVAMDENGPDMDQVESLVTSDDSIKGIWCVPKYANPSGCVYSDEVVDRIARLGSIASPYFRVMYDNAYAVHDLTDQPPALANIWQACERHNTQDYVIQFASTSKVTIAGAGLSFVAASDANLASFKAHMQLVTIGPDKLNQQRHVKFFQHIGGIGQLMDKHRALIKPKFDAVQNALQAGLGNRALGQWTEPDGGYFVSFYTQPGLATEVVRLAAEAGVKLTPAGAAYPYGKDPQDSHIRLAPSFPGLAEVVKAMEVFVVCVQLATLQNELSSAAGT